MPALMDDSLRQQARAGRKNFLAMAAAYSLGVFNDNFYRRSVVVLAILSGAIAEGWVLVIFAAPYVMFAWVAGWLADRFSKHRVVVLAKALELVAMSLGGVALVTGNWPLLLAMVFVMALQSCLFGPSLNGSIPELYPAAYVPRANSLLN
ncbi:MAG: MFS transporter, partial [Planctomycetota bacterium]